MLLAALSNTTSANATVPSGAICFAVCAVYGEITSATCGIFATCANSFSARALTAGSVTLPWSTEIVSWSVSPDFFGSARCSSFSASLDCVCGSVNLSV